jgi:hypothetical protein
MNRPDQGRAALGKESTMRSEHRGRAPRASRIVMRAVAFGGFVSALICGVPPATSTAAPGARPGSPVFIGADGKLSGPMTGYAWVAAGPEASIASPAPCNAQGCFKDTRGQLCTRGSMPALRCTGQGTPHYACNWDANWGAMIGMNPTAGGPWQSGAPTSISIAYQGGRGTYRLNAHVAGDPDKKNYCVDVYPSGQVVDAAMLRTECWGDKGQPLGSFRQVDKLMLQLTSSESPIAFDYCITAVAVNGTAGGPGDSSGGSHVAIGDHGKRGGEMGGYAWVAGGTGTTFTTPQPCNDSGCFRNTQGRLCARGTIASLACTNEGTPLLSCDWAANWGAVIGMNANLARGAWGAAAPSAVAVTYAGPPARYQLMAHVAGDPDNEIYCLAGYQSGQMVDAAQLQKRCWTGAGAPLRGFQNVDKIGLQVLSARDPVSFDVCVSDIVVR